MVLVLQFHKEINFCIINSAHIAKSCQENKMLHIGYVCLPALCIHLFIPAFVVNLIIPIIGHQKDNSVVTLNLEVQFLSLVSSTSDRGL